MSDIQNKKDDLLDKLNNISANMDKDTLKNATKEEVIEYLMLVDKLKATLLTIYEE